MDQIPRDLPALAAADAISHKAAKLGFDWRSIEGVFDKISEELQEIRSAGDALEREEELGDVLFALANLARWLQIDPESALRKANAKFSARFRAVERFAHQQQRPLSGMSDQELDGLWTEAKRAGVAD